MTVLPLKEYEATDIKKIRNDIGATQVVFAQHHGGIKKDRRSVGGRAKQTGWTCPPIVLAMVQEDPTILDKYCWRY